MSHTTFPFICCLIVGLAAVVFLFSLPSTDYSDVLFWLKWAGVWSFMGWFFKDTIVRIWFICWPPKAEEEAAQRVEAALNTFWTM